MTNLKPCPFCGTNNAIDQYIHVTTSEVDFVAYVECWQCEAQGPHVSTLRSQDAVAVNEAARKWNIREPEVDTL
jgi:Lar family restriction alleviation protein